MAYISDNARFNILDDVPADVWEETDPAAYLCIIGEEPHDYYGSFSACVYTSALYRGEHVGASAEYLATCALAPEDTARRILAHYLRQWASLEDEDAAALLLEDAERIARG